MRVVQVTARCGTCGHGTNLRRDCPDCDDIAKLAPRPTPPEPRVVDRHCACRGGLKADDVVHAITSCAPLVTPSEPKRPAIPEEVDPNYPDFANALDNLHRYNGNEDAYRACWRYYRAALRPQASVSVSEEALTNELRNEFMCHYDKTYPDYAWREVARYAVARLVKGEK